MFCYPLKRRSICPEHLLDINGGSGFLGTVLNSINNALTTSGPMSSTSEDSTKVDSDISVSSYDHKGLRQRITSRAQNDGIARDILLFLIAFRIVNALSIRTFFQPDEYFQSLEPAWQVAFGTDSGTWITWVRATRPFGQSVLMYVAGMETSPSIRYPSLFICGDLQSICSYFHCIRSLACVPRRPLDSQPKGASGINCSCG